MAISGGKESETLIRRGSRIANRAGADLMVLQVWSDRGSDGASPSAQAGCRRLVDDLGASFHTVVGDDIPAALLDFARGVNATQLVRSSLSHQRKVWGWALAVALPATAPLVGTLLRQQMSVATDVIAYFFVPPIHSLSVAKPENLVTSLPWSRWLFWFPWWWIGPRVRPISRPGHESRPRCSPRTRGLC
nr:Osmosensitive K+ channel histidine kinase KdpD [Kibdelosporangium sp. MJ126-NF4]CTQ98889.1 Osmosensitive K+ channel histidine kinase KdpD (EC 2.7.3.-) [Kibdelosporangium sp. MJ126-NF4]